VKLTHELWSAGISVSSSSYRSVLVEIQAGIDGLIDCVNAEARLRLGDRSSLANASPADSVRKANQNFSMRMIVLAEVDKGL